MSALSYHPNIAKLIGYTEEPNSLVLPMYCGDLDQLIHDQSYSYTSTNMLQITREMACAIESSVLWASLLPFIQRHHLQPFHLLYFLSFAKTYDTFDVLSSRFKVTPKTVQKWIWIVAELLSESLHEVLSHFQPDSLFFCFVLFLFLFSFF